MFYYDQPADMVLYQGLAFLVFEEDRTLADQVHCHYLMGLACFGYGRKEEASRAFRRDLELDNSHLNCRIYLEMAEETAG